MDHAESFSNYNRVLTRTQLDQFDTRLVTQMGRYDDTQRIIDTLEAGQLGDNRAIVFRDDRNTRISIKPCGMPELEWFRTRMLEVVGSIPYVVEGVTPD